MGGTRIGLRLPVAARFMRRGMQVFAGATLVCVGAATVASAAPSSNELNGGWAPFDRCPVDAPAMLAADGVNTVALCLASSSSGGSIKLGNTTVPTTGTDLQFGLTESGGQYEIVPPPGGALVADPVNVPGGLLGLMCPSDIPVVSNICDAVVDSHLNKVTATVEPAGTPSGFNIVAGLGQGKPILKLPVKIHLQNPILGSTCYIGSDNDPIVLHPENVELPSGSYVSFDGDGTPNPDGVVGDVVQSGTSQSDDEFSVPGASGCGAGLLDWAVNLKQGIPSASGNNSLVLRDAVTHLAGLANPSAVAPNDGKTMSDYWHSAERQ